MWKENVLSLLYPISLCLMDDALHVVYVSRGASIGSKHQSNCIENNEIKRWTLLPRLSALVDEGT